MRNTISPMLSYFKTPLFVALIIATVLSAILSILLYVNEDWRQSTLVMIEEMTDANGEAVQRVKVERPEPNREQIKEIARNREMTKRKDLKESVRQLEKALTEIESAEQLSAGEWDRLAALAFELDLMSREMNNRVTQNSEIAEIPFSVSGSVRIMEVAARNAAEIRTLAEGEITFSQAMGQLGNSHEMVALMKLLDGLIDDKYKALRLAKQSSTKVSSVALVSGALTDLGEEYLKLLEEVVYDYVPEEAEMTALDDIEGPNDNELLHELSEALSDEAMDAMDTSELYETIQSLAESVDEAYADNRAAELAVAENISLAAAQEQIFRPETDTGPELNEALAANDPNNLESFEAFNEALDQAARASERMARTAENRRNQIVGTANSATSEKRSAESLQNALQQRSQIQSAMSMMASNDGRQQGNVQDMRALMAQSYSLSSGQSSGESPGMDAMTLGANSPTDLGQSQSRASNAKDASSLRLSQGDVMRQALPGRRLDQSSKRQGWIFLDTWYIIGPWDRPRTNSFDTRFPPETLIDVDAEYQGKTNPSTGQPIDLKWRFVQTDNIRTNPPDEISNSVYYAYTEVFSETAMEVLIAVASDDIAKLWVNDLVVWQDQGLSSWRLDEGFRRILLKPGYNSVLIRVENGPSVCYFSVLMCPSDVLTSR